MNPSKKHSERGLHLPKTNLRDYDSDLVKSLLITRSDSGLLSLVQSLIVVKFRVDVFIFIRSIVSLVRGSELEEDLPRVELLGLAELLASFGGEEPRRGRGPLDVGEAVVLRPTRVQDVDQVTKTGAGK